MYLLYVLLIVVAQSVENVVKGLQIQRKISLFFFRRYFTWVSKFMAGQFHFFLKKILNLTLIF